MGTPMNAVSFYFIGVVMLGLVTTVVYYYTSLTYFFETIPLSKPLHSSLSAAGGRSVLIDPKHLIRSHGKELHKLDTEVLYERIYVWLNDGDVGAPLRRFLFRFKGQHPCPGLSRGVQISYGHDYGKLSSSDVVLLFYKSTWNWDRLMQSRSDHQKWIFWTYESPVHTPRQVIPPFKYFDKTYDYVMTYRTGATNKRAVLAGAEYGRYVPNVPSAFANMKINWAENKTKLVAWIASNCVVQTWDRPGFVRALSRHINVDSFGLCGNKRCGNLTNCGLQKYKFYLALENSECRDYITEKFWYNSLTLGLVPIAYGAPKEDYTRHAPPNSFIHVQDFSSVSDLADYLHKLDKDDELYNKYFDWRSQGSVIANEQHSYFHPQNLCKNVISRVLEDEKRGDLNETPVVENWKNWWTDSCKSACRFWPYPIRI